MNTRNLAVLGLAAPFAMAGTSMVALIGGILGTALAPTPALATLPVATMIVGVASFSIPAALLMKRVGRRRGFLAGAAFGVAAAALAALAVQMQSFTLLCLATLAIGWSFAFVPQYRFAAAESVTPERAGTAVSLVLLGGAAAGVIGPEVAKRTQDAIGRPFAGSFLALIAIYLVVAMILSFYREAAASTTRLSLSGRPLRQIVRQRGYVVAAAAGMAAYGTMNFIMTATPISMHVMDGMSLEATATVIQSHVLAMYLPCLVSGVLVARFGARPVMGAGVLAMLACVGINTSGHEWGDYWSALVLLGIGWNFLFVGGTVLLTANYLPEERFKAQAANDFLVFGTQATAALTAGTVLDVASWRSLNLIVLPLLLGMLSLLGSEALRSRRGGAVAAASP